jgi:glutathione peroxidase-family protein
VTFPLAKKSDVNGDNANEVFRFLKSTAPGILGLTRIKWNFEKFLVNSDASEVKRYASSTSGSK